MIKVNREIRFNGITRQLLVTDVSNFMKCWTQDIERQTDGVVLKYDVIETGLLLS